MSNRFNTLIDLRERGNKNPNEAMTPAIMLNAPAYFHFLSVFNIKKSPMNTPIISLTPKNIRIVGIGFKWIN